jgi:hypothetical protein
MIPLMTSVLKASAITSEAVQLKMPPSRLETASLDTWQVPLEVHKLFTNLIMDLRNTSRQHMAKHLTALASTNQQVLSRSTKDDTIQSPQY